MDWDWEDGPPRETRRGAPRGDAPERGEETDEAAATTGSFSEAVERFERPPAGAPEVEAPSRRDEPEPDDERTIFLRRSGGSAPAAEGMVPLESPPQTSPGRPDRAGGRSRAGGGQRGPGPGEQRPRTPVERAAARARRRRQVRRRRLVALAVLVVVVVLLVVLVVRGCGGSSPSQASLHPAPVHVARLDARLVTAANDRRPPVLAGLA